MSEQAFGIGYLIALLGVVAGGAVIPILPTGAAVSAAAALAEKDNMLLIVAVVMFGAAGAYIGDLGTYAFIRFASRRVVRRFGWLDRRLHKPRQREAIERVEHEIETHAVRTLVLSRLVPGGQTPVLLAAAVGGYPWTRYVIADIAAALLWSAVYAATGLLGRAVFSQAWEGVVAGIALVVVISLAANLWTRRRRPALMTSHGSNGRSDAPPSVGNDPT